MPSRPGALRIATMLPAAGPRETAASTRRCGANPAGIVVGCAFALGAAPGDASAAALGGSASSVGLIAAVATWLFLKGWQAHLELGGASTWIGLFALAAGAVLLWRAGATRVMRRACAAAGASQALPADAVTGTDAVPLPAGVDRDHLLAGLRDHFFELQTAWDRGAPELIGSLTTPDMRDELWAARSAGSATPSRTDVLRLDLRLLMFEERGTAQVVGVEFSGQVREAGFGPATPFRELWMLTRAGAASPWRLARHQALL